VVATCGTALTPEHLAVLKRLAAKITILFDGDAAGIDATERAMEIGLDHGMILHGATLPQGRDPDEILLAGPKGTEQMAAILAASAPLLDRRISELVAEAEKSTEAKSLALKKIGSWLARFKDPVGREIRIDEVCKKFGVSRAVINQAIGIPGPQSIQKPQPVAPKAPAQAPKPSQPQLQQRPVPPPTPSEKLLLQALMSEGSARFPADPALTDLFRHPVYRKLTAEILRQEKEGGGQTLTPQRISELFPEDETPAEVRSIIAEALLSPPSTLAPDMLKMQLRKALKEVWARFSHEKAARMRRSLAEAEARKDLNLQGELMKEYLDLQRKMKEFNSFYDQI
jgi:DNA primase